MKKIDDKINFLIQELEKLDFILNQDIYTPSRSIFQYQTSLFHIHENINTLFFDTLLIEILDKDNTGLYIRNVLSEIESRLLTLEKIEPKTKIYGDFKFKVSCFSAYAMFNFNVEDIDEINDVERNNILFNENLHKNFYKLFLKLFEKVIIKYEKELIYLEKRTKVILSYNDNYYLSPLIVLQIVRLSDAYCLFNKSEFELLYNIFNLNFYSDELKVNKNQKIRVSYLINFLEKKFIDNDKSWSKKMLIYFDLNENTYDKRLIFDEEKLDKNQKLLNDNLKLLFEEELKNHYEPLNTKPK